METQTKDTIVTFILDESGSMDPVREKTISGFNEYVSTLKSDGTPILLRLMTFNSGGARVIYRFEDVSSIRDLTRTDYRPDHQTPLYDAIARGIFDTDAYLQQTGRQVDVIFTIMTDGLENKSRVYDRSQVFELISKREQKGWMLTYLGANQDAWYVGRSIGIVGAFTGDYDASDPGTALRAMADSTLRAKREMHAGRRPERSFTHEERGRMSRRPTSVA